MKYRYDLHIHSALSPCAEEEMTPVTVVGQAALSGLDFVAIADHNAIGHVPLALRAGEEFGVAVVPAVEVQTREDIHLLCLFRTYGDLEKFFARIPVSERRNRADLFGEQLYFDEDDNIVGREERMLLDSAAITCEEVRRLAFEAGGAAVPAHIDRDANSMLKILGACRRSILRWSFRRERRRRSWRSGERGSSCSWTATHTPWTRCPTSG